MTSRINTNVFSILLVFRYTVLVDKTKAMLVSKSTKNSHSQWEGSLDHDNFIVLQKMQRGQVTEAFSHMMSSVEDRLNFAEAAEEVLALYDAADEEGNCFFFLFFSFFLL